MAETTGGLTAPVTGGTVDTGVSSTSKAKKAGSEMGKDEFLQLLVAQMKYQDPLQPTDNTQYVSQLATFSSLEQMQNLNQTTVNSQAFGLVGQEVIMKTTSSSGKETYAQGTVDFVTMSGKKTMLSIEGKLYSAEDLYSVIGYNYRVSQKIPSVKETELAYNHDKPEDQVVEISLGKEEFEASAVVVYLNGKVVSSDHLSYEDGKITIKKEAFSGLDAGTYKLGFVFNDPLTTAVADKVTVKITGDKPKVEETDPEEGDGTEKDGEADPDDEGIA